MIVFKFDHLLYMQYDQVVQLCLDGWSLDETCGIDENGFIFPVENGYIYGYSWRENKFPRLRFSTEQRNILHSENVEEWNVDGDEAQTCRFLLMLVRRNNQIHPFADDYMISVLLKKLNQSLEDDGLSVEIEHIDLPEEEKSADENTDESAADAPKTLMVPIFKLHGGEVSMEQFFLHIEMASQKQLTQPIIQYIAAPADTVVAAEPVAEPEVVEEIPEEPEPVAEPEIAEEMPAVEETPELPGTETIEEKPEVVEEPEVPEEVEIVVEDEPVEEPVAESEPEIPDEIAASEREHFVKAIQLFDRIIGDATPGTEKYNSVSFNMGELMYCRDDMTCAAYFYQLCDIEKVEDADNYYERLGHCYLDNKMGAYAVPLKLYFKAEQNEDFRKSHQEQLKITEKISPDEIAKFRKLCIKQGKERYMKR